jgi:Holliday junction DNA helicase RuvA
MIERLSGKLLERDAGRVVIDCGGVGYGAAVSLNTLEHLGKVGDRVDLWVHTHMGQDSLRLFGFADAAERATFLTLINTSRVGPKLALAVLSALTPEELGDAVGRGDTARMLAVPGVGKKTAERLLMELRDRLPSGKAAAKPSDRLFADLVSALLDLGYNDTAAQTAARQALDERPAETDIAALMRGALRAGK